MQRHGDSQEINYRQVINIVKSQMAKKHQKKICVVKWSLSKEYCKQKRLQASAKG